MLRLTLLKKTIKKLNPYKLKIDYLKFKDYMVGQNDNEETMTFILSPMYKVILIWLLVHHNNNSFGWTSFGQCMLK